MLCVSNHCNMATQGLLLCYIPTTPPWVKAQGPVLKVSYYRQRKRTIRFVHSGRAGDRVQWSHTKCSYQNKHKVWNWKEKRRRESNWRGLGGIWAEAGGGVWQGKWHPKAKGEHPTHSEKVMCKQRKSWTEITQHTRNHHHHHRRPSALWEQRHTFRKAQN